MADLPAAGGGFCCAWLPPAQAGGAEGPRRGLKHGAGSAGCSSPAVLVAAGRGAGRSGGPVDPAGAGRYGVPG